MSYKEQRVLEGTKDYLKRVIIALAGSPGSYARGSVRVAEQTLKHIEALEQIFGPEEVAKLALCVAPKEEITLRAEDLLTNGGNDEPA